MSRDFVVYTGIKGAELYEEALYEEAVVKPNWERAAQLLCLSLIDKPTYNSLVSMIKSPDKENLEVAIAIMDVKKPIHYGNNIYSGDAQI